MPAVRAAATAAAVLAAVLLWGDPVSAGIAYFGVACAAVFVHGGEYRIRAAMVLAQAAGASGGMIIGAALPSSEVAVVAAAMVVGAVAGAVGRVGPAATGFGMMAVIGVAYTQFGRLEMAWWQPVVLYLAGSALLLVVSLVGALAHPDRYRRRALSEVFTAAAASVRASQAAAGVEAARHRLALASASARQAMLAYRIGRPQHLDAVFAEAQAAAGQAATVSADPDDFDPADADDLVRDWEAAAAALRHDAREGPKPARRPEKRAARCGPRRSHPASLAGSGLGSWWRRAVSR